MFFVLFFLIITCLTSEHCTNLSNGVNNKKLFVSEIKICKGNEMKKFFEERKLEEITLSRVGLENLRFLENQITLKHLNIEGNMINSFEGINNLKNIISINLSDNQIQEIKALDSSIKQLNLSKNKLSSLNTLDKLQLDSLEEFYIAENKIKSIEKIKKAKNLKKLVLSHNKIHNIEEIGFLEHLELLFLDNNQITNIKSLKHLTKLKILKLDHNKVSSLREIFELKSVLPDLKEISLVGNPLDQTQENYNLYKEITKFIETIDVDFAFHQFTKDYNNPACKKESKPLWCYFLGFKGSKEWKCLDNQVSHVTGFQKNDHIMQLTSLILLNNSIGNINIKEIEKLKNLELLFLLSNEIELVALNFSKLPNLKKLSLEGNKIEKFSGKGLRNLETLNLNNNNIQFIKGFAFFKNLKRLEVRNNSIFSLEWIGNFSSFKHIEIDLRQNEIPCNFENKKIFKEAETRGIKIYIDNELEFLANEISWTNQIYLRILYFFFQDEKQMLMFINSIFFMIMIVLLFLISPMSCGLCKLLKKIFHMETQKQKVIESKKEEKKQKKTLGKDIKIKEKDELNIRIKMVQKKENRNEIEAIEILSDVSGESVEENVEEEVTDDSSDDLSISNEEEIENRSEEEEGIKSDDTLPLDEEFDTLLQAYETNDGKKE